MTVKEKLINVTVELIKESNGDIDKITIRDITKRAGVGVGLINYHFQNKNNLLDICVQRIISGVIAQSNPDMAELSPMEKLKRSVKIPVDFLMSNPEISRLSVIGDLTHGESGDNTFKTLSKYFMYACGLGEKDDTYFRAAFLIHGLQGIFLRRELYKDRFDFCDKAQRDKLIDGLVESIFGGQYE